MSDTNIAGSIIQILAGLPEFLRKPMLKNRLIEFFSLSEDEKKETVTNALNAAPAIAFNVLSNLVKTWMEVLCEFDEEKRKAMFGAYLDVIIASPDIIAELNIDGLLSVFNALPDQNKQLLQKSLHSLLNTLSSDDRAKFVNAVPENARKILDL